jgi:hypothetical protein
LVIGSKSREKGADRSRRPLDNERPTTTYLSVAALPPAVTGSPRGTGEVPRREGGASPCAQCSWSASFFQTKLKKRQALSQKRAEASCVQRPAKRALADAKPLGFFLALAELIASG